MEIRPWLLLLCFSAVLPKTLSQASSYLVTAPRFLRLDAEETVLVQLFGYTGQVEVYVSLRSSRAVNSVKYFQGTVTLNQANNYQGTAKFQVFPKDLVKGASQAFLLVHGAGINDNRPIGISRSNGFMVIQTDKHLYTPEQSVKVRVFSLNEELRPANRIVFLTFKDPQGEKVDILELNDHNNGIPSMQTPFKIPLNPKLGVWTIEATYSKEFDTKAVAVFQVKEYVLPSISITVKPENNFISSDNFQRFAFSISASYVHGVPVKGGVVFIRYGYISGKEEPVIIPNLRIRKLLSSSGVVDVTEDIKARLASTDHSTLESMNGKYLYITVLVQEYTGGISEETEYTSVKFVKSPYSLQLISTPRFIKPGLPYNIKVLVSDHLGQPMAGIPVHLVDKCFTGGVPHHSCSCSGNEESRTDGFINLVCNIRGDATMAVLKFQTATPTLSAEGQASLTLEAPAYSSPHQRYLYIEPPHQHSLKVGRSVAIQISSAMPNHLRSDIVNYLVLSKGKVVAFGVGESADVVYRRHQIVRLRIKPEMTPSIRLLVYYFADGELVADSLWMEVEGKCVNGLKTDMSYSGQDHRPKSHLLLDVSANQDGLLALSAVDTAIFPLRRNHKDPVNMVLRHIEHSDQGCGGGGGKDAPGVFQLAGLTLLSNAVGQPSQSAAETCRDAVRAKRSLSGEEKNAIVATFRGTLGKCCRKGLGYIPSSVTCEQFAIQIVPQQYQRCREALQDCCQHNLEHKLFPEDLQYSPGAAMDPGAVRAKRSLTEEDKNALVAGYGKLSNCCRKGLGYIPSHVTCEQFANQTVPQRYQPCREALQDCCQHNLENIPEELQYSSASTLINSLTEEQKNAMATCCSKGLGSIPSSVTCEQFANQTVPEQDQPCREALQDCCQRNLENIPEDLQYSPGAAMDPGAVRAKRSLTEEEKNAFVAGYGRLSNCCKKGLGYIPSHVTCEQFANQIVPQRYQPCREALQDCCQHNLENISEELQYSSDLAPIQDPVPANSLTEEQKNAMDLATCCSKGLGSIPSSVTCEQFANQTVPEQYQPCREALQDCCQRNLENIPEDLQYSPEAMMDPDAVRAKRSLTEEQKNAMVAGHGTAGYCCKLGLRFIPSSVTCEQFAIQSISKRHRRCRKALQDCCERNLEHILEDLQYTRVDMGSDFDMVPSLIRSYFPESWLWEVQPFREKQLSVNRSLPDSLTTWEITAVGMFQNGICVADRVQVSVTLPVSVNIPLPYQLVRGEQLDLLGSVYNQNTEPIEYCVTLTVGPEFCLLHSHSVGDSGLRSTACVWGTLSGSGVAKGGPFTLLGLQPGEHSLTFTLMTRQGATDIVTKKLRVVPEGVRQEFSSGGRLDPKSLYGSEKTRVTLKNRLLSNLVPDSPVERVISINGEIMGEMLSVLLEPEGLEKLISQPMGSADAGLDGLLPLVHIYRYLEGNLRWSILGKNIQENSFKLRQRIKEGVSSVLSYRVKEQPSSYSIWKNGKPSTRLTAKVVKTLGLLKDVIPVDYESLGQSVDWLIKNAQNGDGSFKELSPDSKRVAADPTDQSVYLTSFVLISLKRARQIKDGHLQLQSQNDAMRQAVHYISQHAMEVKSVYVRAVATYALTYYDPDNQMASELYDSLETLAKKKGNPVELRYWPESNVTGWLKPDESSGLTVETTAYVLLTAVLKGRIHYTKPILTWLTQDQHYGGGFYSTEDTVLTLEAITEYSHKISVADLNQDINIHYAGVSGKAIQTSVELRENRPMARPIQVQNYGDITVSTGYGNGVSRVKLKTVYYQTTVSSQNCSFEFNIEISQKNPNSKYHSLTACVKYSPPPNDVEEESGLTVLEIQLPTGVQANVDELKPFMEGDIPAILHYELRGNMVVIETEFVPSDIFRCVGFRVRPQFTVAAAASSVFRVYERHVKGSVCEKQFAFMQQDLQRLCVGEKCQCMAAACATYRGNDMTSTAKQRIDETCQDHIKYAYKVKIGSAVAEGDFMTYTATIVQVLKRGDQAFESVKPGVKVDLVKKATCISVDLPQDAHFLVQGSRGSEVLSNDNIRYRFPLDSDAVLELLPNCSPACVNPELIQYEEDLQFYGCG